uniref:Selenoprotein O1 n=1 Tax=Hucho hucho TaxID=62062 RepID=A0A4W5RFC4_9TELE
MTALKRRLAQSNFPRSGIVRLEFDNVLLKKLPLDTSEEPGPRRVEGACFSRVKPQPVVKPRFVAVSNDALLGLNAEKVLNGSRVMPGQADSSTGEFLCSEAVFALGVPTTRSGSLGTSDSKVVRDVYYSWCPLRSLRWLMRTQAGRAPATATMRSEGR